MALWYMDLELFDSSFPCSMRGDGNCMADWERVCKGEKSVKVLRFLYQSCIIGFLTVAVAAGYGSYNIKNVRQTDYNLTTKNRLKIVQISDLHTPTTMTTDKFKTYCQKIQAQHPDILALTGDIFDENTTKEEMQTVAKALGQIKTTYGIFYVFGNHDYNYYTNKPFYTPDVLRNTLKENGIHVLEDQSYQINDNFRIVGRKDASVDRKDIKEVVGDKKKDEFVLLLDYQPKGLKENKKAGVDLSLSGHTHAGQIWPTGQLGELIGVTELNYGHRQDGNYQVIVSSGIGGWGYPIRTGGHSEYVVITLNIKK
ncbi:MAG: metallophosphoesterase [Anaerostipes hadrus]